MTGPVTRALPRKCFACETFDLQPACFARETFALPALAIPEATHG